MSNYSRQTYTRSRITNSDDDSDYGSSRYNKGNNSSRYQSRSSYNNNDRPRTTNTFRTRFTRSDDSSDERHSRYGASSRKNTSNYRSSRRSSDSSDSDRGPRSYRGSSSYRSTQRSSSSYNRNDIDSYDNANVFFFYLR